MSNEETLLTLDGISTVRQTLDFCEVAQSFDTACRPQIVISAVTEDTLGTLTLVRQYSEAILRIMLEFPTREVESGMESEIAVRREMHRKLG